VPDHAQCAGDDRAHGRGIDFPRRGEEDRPGARMIDGACNALRNPATADGGLDERIAGETVGAMQPCGSCFAAGPEAGNGAAPFAVHCDTAHMIMDGGSDRDRLTRRIDAHGLAGSVDAWKTPSEAGSERLPRVEIDAMPFREMPRDST